MTCPPWHPTTEPHRGMRLAAFLVHSRRILQAAAVKLIVIAGAKLRSEVVSADSMLMFTVWRRVPLTTLNRPRYPMGQKGPLALQSRKACSSYCSFTIKRQFGLGKLHAPWNACRRSAALLKVRRDQGGFCHTQGDQPLPGASV
jgi:hypothetical protein